jgi:hypothetical protein
VNSRKSQFSTYSQGAFSEACELGQSTHHREQSKTNHNGLFTKEHFLSGAFSQ